MTFSRAHFSTIIKYIGISFITGAISHGVFSGTRSIITGVLGIICFVIGTLMEDDATNTWKTLLGGAILAIGIGSVTGGLQHFLDSPERSLWITPIGFIVSLVFFMIIHKYVLKKRDYVYALVASLIIIILSIGIFILIENYIPMTANHHEITNTHTSGAIEPIPPNITDVTDRDHHQ